MSTVLLPPNPCLLGIILVAKYHEEPAIVFHYPPRPGQDDSNLHKYFKEDNDDESSSSDDESSTSDPGEQEIIERTSKADISPPDIEADETGSASPEKHDGLRTPQRVPGWDSIFGYDPNLLAKFLSPARSGHKRRFEVSLNDKVFLGRPAFSREDGAWRKRRRRLETNSEENPQLPRGENGSESTASPQRTTVQATEELSETSGLDTGVESQDEESLKDPLIGEAKAGERAETSKQKVKKSKIRRKDDLSMFHVVFIMSPPPLEYHLRVDEMYDNIVRKFSRALKIEQASSGFVSKESMLIARKKRSFGAGKLTGPNPPLAPLYHELLTGSSLAKAIASVYSSISTSRIAHVSLTPSRSLSLQIEMPTSTSILPSLIQPQLPGLWLTTAMPVSVDDNIVLLGPHSALLLLSDLHSILADVLSTDSPFTESLAHYLRVSKPTKSFLQISQSSGIALSHIRIFADHLIRWRRAREIPPLHQRDTYIVSPNADMNKLAANTSTFARSFPTLPALPKILNSLSSTPRPYSTLIPSKDHKVAYMEILAWLLRNGWVTQLRTFAWIRVPPHIHKSAAAKQDHHWRELEKSNGFDQKDNDHLDIPHLASSPALSSHSSTHTAIPLGPSTPPRSPILMSDLLHPTTESSAHLSAMSAYILASQGEDAQGSWDQCVKYFDGKHAVESIAVREGWKRKKVADLVATWENMGFLKRVRHW